MGTDGFEASLGGEPSRLLNSPLMRSSARQRGRAATFRRLVATLSCAALLAQAAGPPGALAQATACQKWDVTGTWSTSQGNGYTPTLSLKQTGTDVGGTATITADQLARAGYAGPTGTVGGSVQGNVLDITITWPPNRDKVVVVGEYRGTLTDGHVSGGAGPPGGNLSAVTWSGSGPTKCMDAPAPPSAPQPDGQPSVPASPPGQQGGTPSGPSTASTDAGSALSSVQDETTALVLGTLATCPLNESISPEGVPGPPQADPACAAAALLATDLVTSIGQWATPPLNTNAIRSCIQTGKGPLAVAQFGGATDPTNPNFDEASWVNYVSFCYASVTGQMQAAPNSPS